MTNTLEAIADSVARSMASAEMVGGVALVSTPLLHPGGSTVVVQIARHGNRFLVSDAGLSRREAAMLGGERIFARVGAEIASRFGVRFDQEAFFVDETESEDLVAAATMVANASRSAVEVTAYRIDDRVARDGRETMKSKLKELFDLDRVATDYEVRGASNEAWTFDAAILGGERLALLQLVTPSVQSAHSAIARFVDIADLDEHASPQLFAILEDRTRTRHLRLLERSAATIELHGAPRGWQQLKRFTAAA